MAPTTYLLFLVLLLVVVGQSRPPSQKGAALKGLSLEDLLGGKYYPKSFNGSFHDGSTLQWLSDRNGGGDLVHLDLKTQREEVIVRGDEFFRGIGSRPYVVKVSAGASSSPRRGGGHVLVGYNPQRVFRTSFVADYALFDLTTRTFKPVVDDVDADHQIQLVKWSPAALLGSAASSSSAAEVAFAYVRKNDVYYYSDGVTTKVTHTGSHVVFNGVTDWVYEEEMFSSNEALWFSGSGRYLAYATFNDTLVDVVHLPLYGEPGSLQYPILESLPYPKAGRENPTARVHVFDTAKKTSTPLALPSVVDRHYVGWVGWGEDDTLLITTLNRHQNETWTFACRQQPIQLPCALLRVVTESWGWIDVVPIHSVGAGGGFVTLQSTFDVDAKYKHAVLFNGDSVVRHLTLGQFNVDKVVAVKNRTLFFSSGLLGSSSVVGGGTLKLIDPAQSHLYSVSLDDDTNRSGVTCVTCNDSCEYNEFVTTAESDDDAEFYVRTCSHADLHDVPRIDVGRFQAVGDKSSGDDKKVVLERNEGLAGVLLAEGVSLPRMKRLSMPIAGTNFNASIILWLPEDLDENKKYPLLIDVYGGPKTQKVELKSGIDWGMTLVSSHSIIYASIDGRGSGRVSDSLLFSVYRSLGRYEVDDQISGAEFILKNIPYVDKERVAIWGWSYGGYVTAMVLGRDTRNVFKCGVSVAPVSSWAFYDTIYTERYMGLPEENYAAYNNSDVTNYVGNFRGKQFLLVHGNADDNVHYQQSMVLARALEKNDVLFRMQSYPDEAHGLGGVRPHLYHTLNDFLLNSCFNQ